MICPSCQTRVDDDAVICESCNAVLDTAFLGDDITNEPVAPSAGNSTRIVSVDQVSAQKERPAPIRAAAPEPASYDDGEPREGRMAKAARMLESAAPPAETIEALGDLARQYRMMATSEKITVAGAGLLLLALALPWQATREEDLIGLLAGAWPVAVMAALVGSAVFMRRHPRLRPLRDLILQASAATSLVVVVACIGFIARALKVTTVRGGRQTQQIAEQWPTVGAYLGLVAAVVMLLGAGLSLLNRRKLRG